MKRHDTHHLSDESEKEAREEDTHKYIFNSSKHSSKDSEEKYIIKESKENFPMFKKYLNKVDKSDSIVSSEELENIFGNSIINEKNHKKKIKKNNKYWVKLNKVKLNKENDKKAIDNFFTYNLTLSNKKTKNDCYYKIDRNCISLINSNNNFEMILNKEKKEKKILYDFNNNKIEGIRKRKNFTLKISNNNNFSINSKIPFLSKNNNYYNNYEKETKFKNFYSKSKETGCQFFLNQNRKLLKSNNSSNNSINIKNYSNKSKSIKSKKLKIKILDKIELLYKIYIGNDNKNLKQTNYNDLNFDYPRKRKIWFQKIKNKKYMNLSKEKNHVGIINNLIRLQARDINYYCYYSKHFGNNDNCPLCKSLEQKNEENIQKKGIYPIHKITDNNYNSWKNRRVYSALSKILSKRANKSKNHFDEIYDNLNWNISKFLCISKNQSRETNSRITDLKKAEINKLSYKPVFKKKNDIFRILNINRSIFLDNNYSTHNRFCRAKNHSLKSN